MAALQARNRNAAQNGKTASAPCRSRNAGDGNDDTETLRRRVEELELENALMREVVEVVKKDPGADLRRLSNREKTLPAPGSLADRGFTAGMPNGKWPADITRDQGRGREGRASRRRSTAMTAGSSRAPPVPVPTPGSPTGCSSRPRRRCRRGRGPWCIPTAGAITGGPDGWSS